MKKTGYITQAAIIAALYVVLTYVSNAFGLANGAIQVRISEALTVLPAFFPSAIPGLFVGCLFANTLTDGVILNIILGSVATLIGAIGTRKLRSHPILRLIPPIISNTIIVPFICVYAYHIPGSWWYFIITVFLGELISAGLLGYIFAVSLKKRNFKL